MTEKSIGNLNSLPTYDQQKVISRNSDNSPRSYIFDTNWDFLGTVKTGVGKNTAISFYNTDIRYRAVIQSTLAYFVESYKEKEKVHPSIPQMTHWCRGLAYISEALNGTNWDALSDDKIYSTFKRNFREIIKSRDLSQNIVNNTVTTLTLLTRHQLCHRIFSIADLNVASSKVRRQHIAIPIGIYQQLLNQAITAVETYHPFRFEINNAMCETFAIYNEEKFRTGRSKTPSNVNERTLRRTSQIQHKIPNFNPTRDATFLTHLMSPCAIVLFAFSGIRIGELKSLTKDSYQERLISDDKSISILKGETTKGTDGLPKSKVWQTHPIAKAALELAYDSTQCLRDLYKLEIEGKYREAKLSMDEYQTALREIESVFITLKIVGNQKSYSRATLGRHVGIYYQGLNIKATKEDVDSFNTLNPSRNGQLKENGYLPRLSPHDFRRTYAVFFRRYGFGTSTSIKFQYKHTNINMSDYYGNNAQLQAMEDILLDNDLLELMHNEGITMGVDIFDEIFNESDHLSGAGGERIAKDKFAKLGSDDRVYMTRAEIETLVRNGTLSVVKLPTGGYCMNASCSRVCGIGEFAAEIKPCEHQVITDNEAKVIQRQNLRLIKTFRSLNSGDPLMNSILIATKQKIKRNEQLISKHNLKFEVFDDKVKGVIETNEV
ncbi:MULTISPECIES: hypothetical protein [unclassified Arsukibacterium]|uniref:hypothetical protein n=1 Tax=unclassified Arsukibacterium TaxID=2635278 RepID=UPI000C6B4919|nr:MULTISPECIES: hypothetical protein [unclassified Arsukibacterium]MAA93803.1 hypothetical protein [Rheinheimera sp.]MBM33029.1 hypothetical protein [Rheinheimera sp.]HAW92971.1 hypothetical protein [Candidatus Azambacteria bacterium]